MPCISALYIYPVKSLGGISLSTSKFTRRGLEYDRRWMLVNDNKECLTQREIPEMALLRTSIENDVIVVYHRADQLNKLMLPLKPVSKETVTVKIWDDYCQAQYADDAINEWFSKKLAFSCKAVYMPDDSIRKLDPVYALGTDDMTGFADAYPVLMISEASLEDLNNRLSEPVPMNRFRPNIVIKGTGAFAEDTMKVFRVAGADFYGVKLCERCIVTTTDQATGERGKEPLKTLATYRNFNNKICFGQNVICVTEGELAVGDEIELAG